MRIRDWSARRALAIAALWPASLLLLTIGVWGAAHAYAWWMTRQSGGTETFIFRLRVANWPAVILILFAPSVALILVWWRQRSNPSDRAS